MKDEKDYIRDIAEIRTMMERTSKFLSLSGWAGIMAGIYALTGAYIAYQRFHFNPDKIITNGTDMGILNPEILNILILGSFVLVMALGTAIFLSYRSAKRKGIKLWDPIAKRLLANMAVPLVAGGLLILILIDSGMIGLIAPFSLIFYGLALYNAGKFTYEEVKTLGLIQIALGLAGSFFVAYGLVFWAIGFGLVHIIYGIYIHYRYEK